MTLAIESRADATRPTGASVWWQAIRPATLWAGVTPVLVGTALCIRDGTSAPLPALAALVGALLIQVGTNLFNDYADFVRGADTEARLGPARVTQKGWLAPRQVALAAGIAFAGAAAVGVYLVVVGGWPIAAIGVCSIAAGLLYTGGPAPLGWLGLGDLFVMAFFGFAAVCGTQWVQARRVTADALWASLAVGALATAILVVNNLRDRHTDLAAGKRTLAARFGARFARAEYALLLAVAYLVPAVAPGSGSGPGWMLAWLSLPLAVVELRGVFLRDGAALNPHLGGTARLGVAFGLLLAVGVLL